MKKKKLAVKSFVLSNELVKFVNNNNIDKVDIVTIVAGTPWVLYYYTTEDE